MRRGAAVVLAAMAAGCATAPPAPDPGIDPRGYWTVAAVNGQPTGGGEHFRFILTPPTGSAQFGCNAGGGSLAVKDGWVVAGDWIITAAGCRTKRIAKLERMGFDVTARPMGAERTATGIRLRNERGTIDLARRAFPNLAGRWQVVAVNGRPVTGAAEFDPPRFSISFGCNDGRGTYRQDGESLAIGVPLATTERGCIALDGGPAESMQNEDEGFRIAARPMRITFYGPDRIRLSNEAGTIELERT